MVYFEPFEQTCYRVGFVYPSWCFSVKFFSYTFYTFPNRSMFAILNRLWLYIHQSSSFSAAHRRTGMLWKSLGSGFFFILGCTSFAFPSITSTYSLFNVKSAENISCPVQFLVCHIDLLPHWALGIMIIDLRLFLTLPSQYRVNT